MKRTLNGTEKAFLSDSAEERASMIVNRYFHMTDGVSDRQEESFAKWLTAPENRKAKDRAMERIFTEIMEKEEVKVPVEMG